MELVPYLATRASGGTVVYSNVYGGIIKSIQGVVSFLPHDSKVYRLEDIDLVHNLATRDYGGTVVYPSVY